MLKCLLVSHMSYNVIILLLDTYSDDQDVENIQDCPEEGRVWELRIEYS